MLMLKYKTEDAYRVSRCREGHRVTADMTARHLGTRSNGAGEGRSSHAIVRPLVMVAVLVALIAANRFVSSDSVQVTPGVMAQEHGVALYRADWIDDILDLFEELREELENPPEPEPSEESVDAARIEVDGAVNELEDGGVYQEPRPEISDLDVEELLSFMNDLIDFLYDYTSDNMSNSDKTVN